MAGSSVRVRRGWLAGSLAVALVVAVVGGWALSRSGSSGSTEPADVVLDEPGVFQEPSIATNAPVSGTPFPDVPVRTINGDEFRTADLVGTPLVVNVWFVNCPPCRRELPAFAEVHAEYGDRVRFVGINPVDDGSSAVAFAESLGVRYENLLDPNGEFLSAAGIGTFPSTLLVSADGIVVVQRGGEIDAPTLTRMIEDDLL